MIDPAFGFLLCISLMLVWGCVLQRRKIRTLRGELYAAQDSSYWMDVAMGYKAQVTAYEERIYDRQEITTLYDGLTVRIDEKEMRWRKVAQNVNIST